MSLSSVVEEVVGRRIRIEHMSFLVHVQGKEEQGPIARDVEVIGQDHLAFISARSLPIPHWNQPVWLRASIELCSKEEVSRTDRGS